ncbi:hypothetical protein MMC19_007490 [Ptychographa xylographoides]|nr:hypothetical protein [Ptychographa xylographoides]
MATPRTTRISVPAAPTLDPSLRTKINSALLEKNAIPTIHASLLHECQASGWLDRIKARIYDLLRSGECASYGEVMAVVMGEMKGGERDRAFEVKRENGVKENGVNGTGKANGISNEEGEGMRVPVRVVEEGVKIVRGVLDGVVDVVVEE